MNTSTPSHPKHHSLLKKQTAVVKITFFAALFASAIILITLTACFVSTEMDWSLFDFVLIWSLLFCAGALYKWITLFAVDSGYRAAVGLAILTGVFMIWSNLGVGIVGSEDEPFNLVYVALLALGLIAAFWVRFEARSLFYVMLSMAMGLGFITLLAFGLGMHRIPHSSTLEILAVHSFLAVPIILSGILFHHAAEDMYHHE